MSLFCCRELYPYRVTVHLSGRHPYLDSHDLDYESRDETLTVPAKDWNHAAKVALQAARALPNKWSWWVTKIEKVDLTPTQVSPQSPQPATSPQTPD